MAEGWALHLRGDVIEPCSAGIEVHGLNQRAVTVMAEAGVDISGHESRHVRDYLSIRFDYVITVCGHADVNCPVFPGDTKVVHHGFDDPPLMAGNETDEEKILSHYRRVRDEIREYIETLPESL
ncbi:MAG: arsenate reductase ArsC [Bacteroidales bacterium]|nr:arsenate reductase ArsC [Candidatus Latescibacterota bacterium]